MDLRVLIRRLRGFIARVMEAGTELQPDPRERRRIFVNNGFALICLAVNLVYLVGFPLAGRLELWRGDLFWAALFASTIVLNRRGFFTLSRTLLLLVANLATLWSFFTLGLKGHVSLLFGVACLPLLMCNRRQWPLAAVSWTCSVGGAALMVLGTSHLQPLLSPSGDLWVRGSLVASTFAALAAVMVTFVGSGARAEAEAATAHARVRLLLDRIDQGVATIKPTGALGPERSLEFDRWFGQPAPGTPFAECLDRLKPGAGSAFAAGFAQLTPGNQPLAGLPSRLEAAGRHYQLTYRRTHPEQDGSDVLVVVTDVTSEAERAQSEAERRTLETSLVNAQKLEAVGRLASGIAHEINTPAQFASDSLHFLSTALPPCLALNARYRTLLESIAAEAGRAEVLERLQRAEAEADFPYFLEEGSAAVARALEGVSRIATLVRAMKEFAHPSRRELAPADLNHALQTTLTVALAEYRSVADVELDLGPLPLFTCDVGELNQVFLNLVVNAGHAIADKLVGKPGRGVIRVRSRAGPGRSVTIEVSDTGCGVAPEHRSRIFEQFFTTKEVGRGTGQGLALSHNIVVCKYGGQLDFESEPGQGTTFRVTLPIDPKQADVPGVDLESRPPSVSLRA